MASLFNGLNKKSQTFFVILNVGCKSSFISNIGGILAIFSGDDLLQSVIHFSSYLKGMREVISPNR
jgi:uncharacterized membrane protein